MNPRQWLVSFLKWRIRNVSNKNFVILLSVLIGLCSGIAAVILKSLTHYIRELVIRDYEDPGENYLFFALPFIGIFITVLFFKYLIKESAGHGVSSILYAISKKRGQMKPHKMYSAVVGSAFTVGFGGSTGLEAPIVATGSAIGSNIGRFFKLEYKYILLLIGCGSTGAIAAIFNAPIAALIFALEVLMLDLTLGSLIPLLLASVTGTITAHLLLGEEILFKYQVIHSFQASETPFYILLGLVCGLVSVYFTRTVMAVEKNINKTKNDFLKAIFGGLLLGTAIFIFPPLFGEGYESIVSLLDKLPGRLLAHSFFFSLQQYQWAILLFLLLVMLFKPVATALTIGSGGAGGIFAPSLFVGALTGFILSGSLNLLNPTWDLPQANFTLIGMSGLVAGVLHAPLTALFLIAELTGGYQLIVPLMITSGISLLTAKAMEPHSIYTKRLAQKGQLITHHKDRAVLTLLNISEVIETDFEPVGPKDNLGKLIKVVARSRRNIFPVVDKDNFMLGIVMLDDIREIMFEPENYTKIKVEDIMALSPAHLSVHDSMEHVMKIFTETGAWNLPVLDAGKYQGFISKSKMFSAYRKVLMQFSGE